MAESVSDTNALAGKGKRVTGTFLLMLGAGIVLESSLRWTGGMIMFAGAAAFVRGLLDIRPQTAARPHPHVAIDAHGEGRL